MATNLIVWCCVLGKELGDCFHVSIPPSCTVFDLKEAIIAKWKVDCLATELRLWRVLIAMDDPTKKLEEHELTNQNVLPNYYDMSQVFPDPPPYKHVHIVVKVPEPFAINHDTISDLLSQRGSLYDKTKPRAPSEMGKPHAFEVMQESNDVFWWCSRPESKEYTTPLALLEPLFGSFVDKCKSVELEPKDMLVARELKTKMSLFYEKEDVRRDAFNQILQGYDIPIMAGTVGQYTTDGHVEVHGRPALIDEMKLEIAGSAGAEPSLQVFAYYNAFLRASEVWKDTASCHPCFVVFVAGPHIGFGGCAMTSRPTMEVFALLPLCFHSSNEEAYDSLARHLSALKSSVFSLQDRYAEMGRFDSSNIPSPPTPTYYFFPHQHNFFHNGCMVEFLYDEKRADGRLIFNGRTSTEQQQPICIKFVRRYGAVVHRWFARRGLAPEFFALEALPGGWYMVVMERLDPLKWVPMHVHLESRPENRVVLRGNIRAQVTILAGENLVHGDIRDTNVLVDCDGNFKLIDFDWAGKAGEVRYPRFINTDPVLERPLEVAAFQHILPAHDLHMVDRL